MRGNALAGAVVERNKVVRDLVVLVIVLTVVLGGLYLYTMTWPPAVIVESSSMMHRDSEVGFGRIGTIDPGDLVLVKRVGGPGDVGTLVEDGARHYGKSGDILVYHRPDVAGGIPIIHRAVAYVEVISGGYRMRWDPARACEGGATKDPSDPRWCDYGPEGVFVPSVPISDLDGSGPYKPGASGFLTKGDNPVTNTRIDQVSIYHGDPVPLDHIEGKARGELPWLGLVKLSLQGRYNEDACGPRPEHFLFFHVEPTSSLCAGWLGIGYALAPTDLWICLAIVLLVLIGGPLAFDVYKHVRERREVE